MRAFLPLLGLAVCASAQAQATHLLRAQDFYFLPDTVVMVAGDSLKFQTQQGPHNIMQVDQAAWLANQPVGNGGFHTVLGADSTFAIDTAGTYYFVCEPHSFMAMKGVLLVAPNGPTSIEWKVEGTAFLFPNPASTWLEVSWPAELAHGAEVFLIDALGRAQVVAFTWQGNSIRCAVAPFPRGPAVMLVRSGPRSFRSVVLLE